MNKIISALQYASCFLIFMVFSSGTTFSQVFDQTYDYTNFTGVDASELPSGYKVLGTNDVLGTVDPTNYVEIRTDANGSSTEVNNYSISNPDGGLVYPAKDGNYFIFFKTPTEELKLEKVTPSGATLWMKSYSLPDVESIRPGGLSENVSGIIFLTGSRDVSGGTLPYSDLFVIKTQSNGNLIWSKTYTTFTEGTALGLSGFRAKAAKDGGCMLQYNVSSPDARAFLKVDAAGNMLYNKSLTCCFSSLTSFDDDAMGNVVYTEYAPGFSGPVNSFGVVRKLNATGDLIFTTELNRALFVPPLDPTNYPTYFLTFVNPGKIIILDDASYLVVGRASATFSSQAFFMVRLNNNGVVQWANNTYDFTATPQVISETSDGGFLVSGLKDSKLWLMKTDAYGNPEPNQGDIDLELEMFTQTTELNSFENISVTVKIKNNSNRVATGVKVYFPPPVGAVYVGGNEYFASQGTFEPYGTQKWSTGPLVPGAEAYIRFNLYTLQEENPLVAYAQVTDADQGDSDSTPGNGTSPVVNEDDEAVVIIGQQPILLALQNNVPPEGASSSEVRIFGINKIGEATPISNIPASVNEHTTNFNAGAYDRLSGRFYFSRFDGPLQASELLFNDLEGNQQSAGMLGAAAASGTFFNGAYYYMGQESPGIYKVTFNIDGTIANESSINNNILASTIYNGQWLSFGDVTYTLDGSTLYGSGTRIGPGVGSIPVFFKVDADGSDYTEICTGSACGFQAGATQIAFGSDAKLYGANRLGNFEFYVINPLDGSSNFITNLDLSFSDLALGTAPLTAPDLRLSNLNVPTSGEPGETISFTFDLRNTGNTTAEGNYLITEYLSTDDEFSPDDIWVGEVPTGNTPVGTISNILGAFDIPANLNPGNYFLIQVADINNGIAESNEINNSAVVPFEVTSGGNICTGDVFLNTQVEVDAFDCIIVDGDLTISGNNITNLDAMNMLTSVTGALYIVNNPALQSVEGLSVLSEVGFRFDIRENAVLSNVNGLENVVSIGDRLWIRNNNLLENLDGFSSLASVGDFLGIDNNPLLTNLDGLSSLTTIYQQLAIDNNAALENLDGLSSLVTVGNFFGLFNNAVLQHVDGLSALNSIGGGLVIHKNGQLDNLEGLMSLVSIDGSLRIFENPMLKNIDGLTGIMSIPHFVAIEDNPLLENLDGLSNLVNIDQYLVVQDNASLSDCCGIFPLLDVDGVAGSITIFNNPSGCSSTNEILTSCAAVCSGDITLSTQAEVDAFGPCSVWDGNIDIEGADITNLESFAGLTEITGYIIINNCPQLQNLNGLQDLTATGSHFALLSNPQLQNVDALSQLSAVGSDFVIIDNDQLSDVDGFSGLTTIENLMFVNGNDELQNLNGLINVDHVGGDVEFTENSQLTSINILSGLSEIDGSFYLIGNDQLTSITGFSGIQSISSSLVISENPLLANMQGFGNLQNVGSFMVIHNNDQLINLNAFSNLTSVNGDFYVYDNEILSDCCGLYPLLNGNGVAGEITIEDNPSFCSSAEEILTSCAGPTDYCESFSEFPWHEWIIHVGLTDISNPSGKSVYSDFTDQVAAVNLGQTYTFDFSGAFSYFTYDEYLRVWIDYNQDGDFEDPNEMVFSRVFSAPPNGTPAFSESGPIFIPDNIVTGETRMRVSMKRGSYPEPCEVLPFGEVEDYTVNVISQGNLPNLAVPNYEIIPGGLNLCFTNPGETFGFFGGTIVNFGTADSGPFALKVFLSEDNLLSPDDVLWQAFTYNSIAPNNADGFTVSNPVPGFLTPGLYYSIIYVDAENQVSEANELDNQQINQVQIGAPDFVVEEVLNIPASVPSGGMFNFDAVLKNISPFSLNELNNAVTVEVFFSNDEIFDVGMDEEIGAGSVSYNEFSNPPLFLNGMAVTDLAATIPPGVAEGAYYLFIRSANVCEQNWQNNLSGPYPIEVDGGEPGTYCDSYGEFPWHEWISRVSIDQQINNNSGKETYSDFTGLPPANITIGTQVNLLIDITFSYSTYSEFLSVWIDFDHNGTFENDEKWSGSIAAPSPGTNVTITRGGVFNIPNDALPGPTRMRVSMKRGGYPGPCEVIPFGEVEDYTVILINNPGANAMFSEELLVLDARRKGLSVDLDWITNTEEKNDYFVVERSVDGDAFEMMETIESIGESELALYYHSQDLLPYEGYNYYRIKEVFLDGTFLYSNVTAVDFSVDSGAFSLFPNPAAEELFVNLNAFAGKSALITIYDNLGRAIYDQQIDEVLEYPHRIDLLDYKNGLHHLAVKVDNLRIMTKPFIISRIY